MIKVPAPVKIRVHHDQLNREVIIINSPMRFGRGGRAKLARLPTNHHVAISGRAICRPRARTMVRLWARS